MFRIIRFVQHHSFLGKTVRMSGIAGIPRCLKHAFSILETINNAKQLKNLYDMQLYLSNAYGSVLHEKIKTAIIFFWIPDDVQRMLRNYYGTYRMRFSTGMFTTEWQRIEVDIATEYTISVIIFVRVMETQLKSTNIEEDDSNISQRNIFWTILLQCRTTELQKLQYQTG